MALKEQIAALEEREGETETSNVTVTSRIAALENSLNKKLDYVDLKPLESKI
jgi:hypothetical protein